MIKFLFTRNVSNVKAVKDLPVEDIFIVFMYNKYIRVKSKQEHLKSFCDHMSFGFMKHY